MVCDSCGESATPADVWIRGEKVALECASCGALNRVTPSAVLAAGDSTSRQEGGASSAGGLLSQDRLLEASLSPSFGAMDCVEQGPSSSSAPIQCHKCGHRQESDQACARCGFILDNYVAGEMEWEQIPEGKEEVWAEADLRWEAVLATGSDGAHEAFVAHCVEHGLEEVAGRKYRFRVADHPDDAASVTQLDAMLVRARASLASRMESTRESTIQTTEATKRALLWVVFALGFGLVLVFVWLYPNLFG